MNRTCTASAILFCIASATQADSLALDDRSGVFSGAARGGCATMAYQDFWLEPLGSECLHSTEDYLDYEAVFVPTVYGVEIAPQMLDGLSPNTNGTLRLTLGIDGWAEGSVTVGAPPLLWGELYGWASIHRCAGGVQEMCYTCGRRHSSDDGYDCSHDLGCAARTSYANACTCAPLLVKVNWDDDNWNFSEDRLEARPCTGDDETEGFRAIGVGRYCCCHGDISGTTSVSELTASSELRLWNGSTAASSSASAFAIEAISASSGIGSATVSYEIRDETNGFLRTVTRQVTAANLEIRPDFNDDGTVDNYDRFYFDDGGTWQLRVRDEPYKFALVSECPSAASASLLAVQSAGTGTVIRTQLTGGTTLPFGTPSSSPLFAAKNETKELFVDTSGGPGTIYLHYSLGFGGAHAPLADIRQIHVVDANGREEWATTNSLPDLVYNFSDVLGDVYWTIYDDEDNIVDYGDDSSFTPIDLPPGNYTVEVYFADVYEDGILGYTSSAPLHVVDVRLVRLFETANEANRISNPTRKDDTTGNPDAETEIVNAGTPLEERYAAPRNYLYTVGDPVTGNFNVSAQFDATGAEGCTNYYCAFYQPDGQKAPGTETNIDLTAESVAFSLPAPALVTNVVWGLRGGLDVNHNATLDNDEASSFAIYTNSANVVKHACIKGITKEQYETDRQVINRRVYWYIDNPPTWIVPNARSFLTLFYRNGLTSELDESYRPNSTTEISFDAFSANNSCFAEWLTHNSGLNFSSYGVGPIVKYGWNSQSTISKFLAKQTPFQLKTYHADINSGAVSETLTTTGTKLKQFYETNVISVAQSLLANEENGAIAVLPSTNGWYDVSSSDIFQGLSPAWVPGLTIDVGEYYGYSGIPAIILDYNAYEGRVNNYDAHGTIGRGRLINPSYRFFVEKQTTPTGSAQYIVTNVTFSCTISDLYDFNHEDGDIATSAASIQIGYGAGAMSRYPQYGKIFMHEIDIKMDYAAPFATYSYPQMPQSGGEYND